MHAHALASLVDMGSHSTPTIRIAAVQAEPEWLNLEAAVEKTCNLIKEASESGVRIIAFPECWIPGYPGWIW